VTKPLYFGYQLGHTACVANVKALYCRRGARGKMVRIGWGCKYGHVWRTSTDVVVQRSAPAVDVALSPDPLVKHGELLESAA